jgi:hypothetical protein
MDRRTFIVAGAVSFGGILGSATDLLPAFRLTSIESTVETDPAGAPWLLIPQNCSSKSCTSDKEISLGELEPSVRDTFRRSVERGAVGFDQLPNTVRSVLKQYDRISGFEGRQSVRRFELNRTPLGLFPHLSVTTELVDSDISMANPGRIKVIVCNETDEPIAVPREADPPFGPQRARGDESESAFSLWAPDDLPYQLLPFSRGAPSGVQVGDLEPGENLSQTFEIRATDLDVDRGTYVVHDSLSYALSGGKLAVLDTQWRLNWKMTFEIGTAV